MSISISFPCLLKCVIAREVQRWAVIIIHAHRCSDFYGAMLKMTQVVILIFVTIKKLNIILFNKIFDNVYVVLSICQCCSGHFI